MKVDKLIIQINLGSDPQGNSIIFFYFRNPIKYLKNVTGLGFNVRSRLSFYGALNSYQNACNLNCILQTLNEANNNNEIPIKMHLIFGRMCPTIDLLPYHVKRGNRSIASKLIPLSAQYECNPTDKSGWKYNVCVISDCCHSGAFVAPLLIALKPNERNIHWFLQYGFSSASMKIKKDVLLKTNLSAKYSCSTNS